MVRPEYVLGYVLVLSFSKFPKIKEPPLLRLYFIVAHTLFYHPSKVKFYWICKLLLWYFFSRKIRQSLLHFRQFLQNFDILFQPGLGGGGEGHTHLFHYNNDFINFNVMYVYFNIYKDRCRSLYRFNAMRVFESWRIKRTYFFCTNIALSLFDDKMKSIHLILRTALR